MATPLRDLDIREYLQAQKKLVDSHLQELLPAVEKEPAAIHRAMRYSIFAGGKRLRPILSLATGQTLGGDFNRLIRLACALEMIHTYSLIHDDLPAMDNDDFRRGMPTLHREFGEAIAILAGNGLLTLAFKVLAHPTPREDGSDGVQLEIIRLVCEAVGTDGGLIGGQTVDLITEGRSFSREQLEYIHSAKTGALLRASVETAALLSNADSDTRRRLSHFGINIGLAFQVVDDILDVSGSRKQLGKSSGKDEADSKATYPALYGIDASRRIARDLVDRAKAELDFLGEGGDVLRRLARFIIERKS